MKFQALVLPGIIFYLLTSQLSGQAQEPSPAVFEIDARLDTHGQTLDAQMALEYTNNSPDTLHNLIMHVYWNAFADKRSAFSLQQMKWAYPEMYFAAMEEMGGYTKLEFFNNDNSLSYNFYHDGERFHSDIIEIQLSEPLLPGQSMVFQTYYALRIPRAFSRPGKMDSLLSFTQWYPRPAMYDEEGWHPMPYLGMGEFYYEFGDYDITLELPEQYILAHTGVCSQPEILDDGYRKYNISARRIVDFAWFASPHFYTVEKEIYLEGHPVTLRLYTLGVKADWNEALDFMERALRFYDQKIGPYPYPQLTAVDGGKGRGGMEYPMITIVHHPGRAQSLDNLIAHEIAHNWFYGVIGTNERRFPWMDEGLTTYYQRRYNDRFYKDPAYNALIPHGWYHEGHELSLTRMFTVYLKNTNRHTVINNPSEQTDPLNYMVNNYEKTAWIFEYLESYLGTESFDSLMQSYYREWSFAHPQPADLFHLIDRFAGKNTEWVYPLIHTKRAFDYEISGANTVMGNSRLRLKNHGDLSVPFTLDFYGTRDSLAYSTWHHGFQGDTIIWVPGTWDGYGRISINGSQPFLDCDRSNNHFIPKRKVFPHQRHRINVPFKLTDSRYRGLNILPLLGANEYDGLMAGSVFSGDLFPQRRFKWYAMPFYGQASRRISGMLGMRKDFIPDAGPVRLWTVGLSGRKFSYQRNSEFGYILDYYKWVPSLRLSFSRSLIDNAILEYKAHFIYTARPEFSAAEFVGSNYRHELIHQVNYFLHRRKNLSDYKIFLQGEYQKYTNPSGEQHYFKLSTSLKTRTWITDRDRFEFRLFAGWFPLNTQRRSSNFHDDFTRGSLALAMSGRADHTYEELYIARNGTGGVFSRQWSEQEGGFKSVGGSPFTTGMSNDWLIALNLKSDVPLEIFRTLHLKPFLDLGWSSRRSAVGDPMEVRFYYSGGFSIGLDDVFGIYLPVWNSSAINQQYNSGLLNRIVFRINFNALNLWHHLDNPAAVFMP